MVQCRVNILSARKIFLEKLFHLASTRKKVFGIYLQNERLNLKNFKYFMAKQGI